MLYEVTLTLKPLLYQFKPQIQFDKAFDYLFDIVAPYDISMICELTGEHNVHFHGVVELENIEQKDRFLNRFRPYSKIFGRKTCSQVVYEDSYKKYMRKSYSDTKKIILDPIVRDSFGVFSMQSFKFDNPIINI